MTKLKQMRRTLIRTAWQDWLIFGYRTEAVKGLIKQIRQAKKDDNQKRSTPR